ncbi:MAG: sulfite exporter TauE/SafE family protein [Rhodothermaceae bacterium]
MSLEFILILVIIFVGSLTQGMTGFGFALVSIPLLSMIIDIKLAIPLAVLCGMVINLGLLAKMKKEIKIGEVKNLIIGNLIGTPIGAYFLTSFESGLLKQLLGFCILLFLVFTIFKIIKPVGLNRKWGYLFGFFAGILGGAFNTNGPPILIYMFLQGWDKTEQKAAITGFFTIASVVTIISYVSLDIFTVQIFEYFMYGFPLLIAGIFLGHNLFGKVSTKLYNRLILTGLSLITIFLIFKI